jgi:exodeoxyribonuclease VII large subunit
MENRMKGSARHGSFDEAPRNLYTVSEITETIKQHLESEFPRVSIIGEIANFKIHTSGHVYFTLRDSSAMIHAVLFRRYAEALSLSPENGMLVIASGRVSHFGGSGQTQIIATDIIPAGHGNMELEFRRILQRLMDEGLTAPERKRRLPPYPETIAVITSPTGAVIRDLFDTLGRRWPIAKVVHIGAEVQGAAAVRSITRAFEISNGMNDIDVVILARGGGSAEDLWTFNNEEVARAVASSRHPVVTGIGHEIDTTIVDYVSDLRAATPTAAAEQATPLIEEVGRALAGTSRRLLMLANSSLANKHHLLEYLVRSSAFPTIIHHMERVELGVDDRVERLHAWWMEEQSAAQRTIDASRVRLERLRETGLARNKSSLAAVIGRLARRSPAERIGLANESLKHHRRMIRIGLAAAQALRRNELAGRARVLAGLDPRGVLKRGYAFCSTADDARRIIPRAEKVSSGDDMMVHFYDGGALCKVREKRKGTPWQRKRALKKR